MQKNENLKRRADECSSVMSEKTLKHFLKYFPRVTTTHFKNYTRQELCRPAGARTNKNTSADARDGGSGRISWIISASSGEISSRAQTQIHYLRVINIRPDPDSNSPTTLQLMCVTAAGWRASICRRSRWNDGEDGFQADLLSSELWVSTGLIMHLSRGDNVTKWPWDERPPADLKLVMATVLPVITERPPRTREVRHLTRLVSKRHMMLKSLTLRHITIT